MEKGSPGHMHIASKGMSVSHHVLSMLRWCRPIPPPRPARQRIDRQPALRAARLLRLQATDGWRVALGRRPGHAAGPTDLCSHQGLGGARASLSAGPSPTSWTFRFATVVMSASSTAPKPMPAPGAPGEMSRFIKIMEGLRLRDTEVGGVVTRTRYALPRSTGWSRRVPHPSPLSLRGWMVLWVRWQ